MCLGIVTCPLLVNVVSMADNLLLTALLQVQCQSKINASSAKTEGPSGGRPSLAIALIQILEGIQLVESLLLLFLTGGLVAQVSLLLFGVGGIGG